MQITIVAEKRFYNPGSVIPGDMILSDVSHGDLILLPGEINPEGEEVLINATSYNIAKRFYDLNTQGYALKAVVRDGYLIPILRNAKGQERYIYTKLIKTSPRHAAQRIGDINHWWPTIEYIQTETEEIPDSFTDNAISIIEEFSSEISEDFAFPTEPLEYIEDFNYIEEG